MNLATVDAVAAPARCLVAPRIMSRRPPPDRLLEVVRPVHFHDPASCQRRGARLDRQHRPQHARGYRRSAGRCGAWRCRPIRGSICCSSRPRRVRPRWIVAADAAGGRPAGLVGPAGSGVELLIGPEALEDDCQPSGGRHRRGGHRRQRRPARHLGGRRSGQDRGPGQQRNPGRGRTAGDRPGRSRRSAHRAGRQRAQRRLSGHASRPPRRSETRRA